MAKRRILAAALVFRPAGGCKHELSIALGLKPEVLLLDEPASGVPGAERHIVMDAIGGLPEVLIIDHDMDLVFGFAQRITGLVGGAITAEGTPREIAAHP
jgi:branched-chain amino acid transport system ATP-binding protein